MASVDPNSIQGPSGFGPSGFVQPELFSYGIEFENKPTASAPAQTVTVTQQIDPNLDWSTFQLGNIGFGSTVISVPAGQTSYSTQVDLTATRGIDVDVTADFNPLTGLATWTFTSIDPTTLDVPADPLAGFLPPDDANGDGTGFVNYTIMPKSGDNTGDTINGQASVVFDINGALQTAQIKNTIDNGPPTSSVDALPKISGPNFAVNWSGSDDTGGSGIADFNIYVSDNGGTFTLWQTTPATETSATYTGTFGHTYDFYSVATDNVGNVQATPTAAQATTQVGAAITVTPVAISAVEGQPFTSQVATFTDSVLTDTLSASITWNDGSSSLGTISGPDVNGIFTVVGSHTFAEETSGAAVSVAVSDSGGVTASATATAAVSDATLTAGTASATAGTEGVTASTLTATFSDANTAATTGDFSGTINWGDGTTASPDITPFTSGAVSGSGGSYTIGVSHQYAEQGNYSIAITVNDAGGSGTSLNATAQVNDATLTAGTASATTGTEGISASTLTATFSDANTAAPTSDFRGTINWGDGTSASPDITPFTSGAVSGSGGSYTIGVSHQYAEQGNYSIAITVNDAGGSGTSLNTTAQVNDATLTAGTASAAAGTEGVSASTLTATFSDANTAAPTSDFSGTINWGDGTSASPDVTPFTSGAVSGSGGSYTIGVSHQYAEQGNYPITITVDDAGGNSTSLNTTAQVNDATLTAGTASAAAGTEGVSASTLTATFSDANTAAPTSDFSGTINWGDGTSASPDITPFTSGAVSGSGGSYTIGVSHQYAEQGSYPVTITVSDAGGSGTSLNATAQVKDATLTAGTAGATASTEGVSASMLTATFSDANTGAPASDFSGTINWGDGTTASPDITPFTSSAVSGSGGSYTIGVSHQYAEQGSYPVTITVSDAGGSGTSLNATAQVNDAALTAGTASAAAGTESVSASMLTATFSDANTGAPTSDFSGTINWGDGTASPDITPFTSSAVSGSGGSYTIGVSHQYAEQGSYPLAITVNDAGGNSTSLNATAQVNDATLIAGTASATASAEGVSASTLTATFSDANTAATTGDFSGMINWGDGTTASPDITPFTSSAVSGSGGSYTIGVSHQYAEQGSYPITITVNDAGASDTSLNATAQVNDATLTAGTANAAAGTEGVSASVLTATFSDANTGATTSDFSGTINWGDGTTASPDITPFTSSAVSGSGGSYTVGVSHQYAEQGSYPITITVNDAGGSGTSLNATAQVNDAMLTAGTASATAGTEGVSASTLTATFSDANTGAPPGDFSGTINWGDGTSASPDITPFTSSAVSGSGGSYTVGVSHQYAEQGNYSIVITVNDAGGSGTSLNATAQVNDGTLTAGTASATASTEGVSKSALTATFNDANIAATTNDFSGTINWGDGTSASPDITPFTSSAVSGSGGSFTIGVSHQYAEQGNYPVAITVDDAGGGTSLNATAQVNDATLTAGTGAAAPGVEGVTPATLSGATFNDANSSAPLSDFSITSVTWGDGSSDASGLSISGSGGSYTVTGSHLYAEDGVHDFTITVKDAGGNTATITGSATIADAALTGVTAASASSGVEGVTAVALTAATFTDANGDAALSDFSITSVNWGDSSSDASGLSISGSSGKFTVTGSHAYADEGAHSFTIVVKDKGGNLATILGTANVADAPLTAGTLTPPVAMEGVAFTPLTVFHFSDANPSATAGDFTATVETGDATLTTSANGQDVSIVAASGGGFDVKLAYTYAEQLSGATFAVSVADKGGQTAATSVANFSVADQALVPVPATLTATQGAAATFSLATFTDPGGAQPLGDYSATINWGDNSTGTASISISNGVFTISGAHTYTQSGTMSAVVTIDHGSAAPVTTTASISVASGVFVVHDQTYTIGSGTVSVTSAKGLLAGDVGTGTLTVTSGTQTGAQGGTFTINSDGSFSYTPPGSFPGYDSVQFTVTDAAGKSGQATVTVLSQHASVVWKFYESVLNRTPDPGGLQYWTNYFDNGGSTGDMAFGFFESDELLNKVLGNYYEQFLLRPLDASGLAYWKGVWHATGGPEQIKAGFADSPEFYNSSGGTPDSWIDALYQRILSRTPDPQGKQFWLNYYQQQVAAGVDPGEVRYQIALGFFDSAESYGQDVVGWFEEYLFRAPTDAEKAQYVSQMEGGASDRTIEQEITNLPEYGNNPPPPPSGTATPLASYYQTAGQSQAAVAAKDALFATL